MPTTPWTPLKPDAPEQEPRTIGQVIAEGIGEPVESLTTGSLSSAAVRSRSALRREQEAARKASTHTAQLTGRVPKPVVVATIACASASVVLLVLQLAIDISTAAVDTTALAATIEALRTLALLGAGFIFGRSTLDARR